MGILGLIVVVLFFGFLLILGVGVVGIRGCFCEFFDEYGSGFVFLEVSGG